MPTLKEEMLEALKENPIAEAPTDAATDDEPIADESAEIEAEPSTEAATEPEADETEENAIDAPAAEDTVNVEPDEFAALADRYGVDVETLQEFSTPKDAETFLALRDSLLFQQAGVPQAEPATENPSPSTAPLGDEIALDLGDLDESDPLAKNLKALRDVAARADAKAKAAEAKLAALERQQQEQVAYKILADAQAVLDAMQTARYGDSSKKLSAVQKRNRDKTLRQGLTFAAMLKGQGDDITIDKALQRFDRVEFADEIAKETVTKQREAAQKRAAHKLGSTRQATSDLPASGQKYTGALKNDPIIMRQAKQALSGR